jgi:hypothetical protein
MKIHGRIALARTKLEGGTVFFDDADLTLTLSKIAGARVELFGAWGCSAGDMA